MWITKHVNLPEPLMDALEKDRLIIFAGAGISMPPPSNLPDFDGLAGLVADGALSREEDEPVDRFLGRLASHGVRVHERVQQILGNADSKPTRVHRAIMQFFGALGEVRVVTTNFDRHFSAASEEVYGARPTTYCAPALPLGRESRGLIHLHGSVDEAPEHLVVTDTDFGRAYLTDGWATRFLRDMFSEFTVLFIGYSHDDPIMRYLARGLVPDTSRFALTRPGQDQHWRHLGIDPVSFPLNEGPDRYSALTDAVEAWVTLAGMGALDHEHRIRAIVQSPPPKDPQDADYVKRSVERLTTARFFTRYARGVEWLRWAERDSPFTRLFREDSDLAQVAEEFAIWFVDNYVCEYCEEALAVVQRAGGKLPRVLWWRVARQLGHADTLPEPAMLGKWVNVLLSSKQIQWRSEWLTDLFEVLRYPDDASTALVLLEYLTRPYVTLHRRIGAIAGDGTALVGVEPEVAIHVDPYWLAEIWNGFFKPHLADLWTRLVPVINHQILTGHLQLRAAGKASDRWDLLSMHRSAIEPHAQDSLPIPFDVLVDIARDLTEYMLVDEPQRAEESICAWAASGVPLLRRLAAHGMTENQMLSPDDKIKWILEQGWVYLSGAKHEIFRLLERSYPSASDSVRTRLLDEVERGPDDESAALLSEQTRCYEVYNFLVWLNRIAPECSIMAVRLKAMQDANPDFSPREHPDFDTWMSEVTWGRGSPVSAEQLLQEEPGHWVDLLLTYQGDGLAQPERKGLLDAFSLAVSGCFEWGSELAVILLEKREWKPDVWSSILWGWQQSTLSGDNWLRVLGILSEHGQLCSVARPIADLFSKGVGKNEGSMPLSSLERAEELADRFWTACASEAPKGVEVATADWLGTAINHPGGMIAEFWISALSRRRKATSEAWAGLPREYRQNFDRILSEESYWAEMGRIVLASKLYFLFALDRDWAAENVLKLLDWSIDSRRAQQAWHGYLSWGRWDEALLQDALPLFRQSFGRLSDELSSRRDRFCAFLASIALFSSVNPVEESWLSEFIKEADAESRYLWADRIGLRLRSVKEEAKTELWNRWMAQYWRNRAQGIPTPLDEREKEAMVLWSVQLEPVFEQVVERITAVQPPALSQTPLYRELASKSYAAKHPQSVTKLLSHLLSDAPDPFRHCSDVTQIVRELIHAGRPQLELRGICDDLARLGCASAADLAAEVGGGLPTQAKEGCRDTPSTTNSG